MLFIQFNLVGDLSNWLPLLLLWYVKVISLNFYLGLFAAFYDEREGLAI